MKKKFLLFLILIIFILSSVTFAIIFYFVDPYVSGMIGVISIIISFLLSIATFCTMILYIIKKAYYRGDVFLFHVYTSSRQGFFIAFFTIISIFFYHYSVFEAKNIFVLFLFFLFLELFIKTLEEPK